MAKYTNLIVLYLLILSCFCYGQFKIYRADTRTPEQIKKAGGFFPRGQSRVLTVAPNISMFAHALGASNGQSTDAEGYVSTTVDEKTVKPPSETSSRAPDTCTKSRPPLTSSR
jgi:cholera enterotoxin subunit A